MADRRGQPGSPQRQPGQPGQPGQPRQQGQQGQPARQRGRPEPRGRESGQPDLPPPPTGPRPIPRLRKRYDEEVRPTLVREFNYRNPMQAPRLEKIVINIGMGKQRESLDNAATDLQLISGQKPVITRAKRSISQFKLRTGEAIGCMVTLRGARMYDFFDKLVNASLPRVRDFSGVSRDAFDGRGNYNLGIREQLIFPEIEYDKIDRVRGMEIAIVTTARTDDEGRRLLELLGMPFRTDGGRQPATDTARTRRR